MSLSMKENNEINLWEIDSDEEKYPDFDPDTDDKDPNCYKPSGKAWENRKNKLIKYFSNPNNITWEKVQKRHNRVKIRYFKGKVEELAERTLFTQVIAVTPAQKLLFLVHLIYNQLSLKVCEHVPAEIWKNCLRNGLVVLDILETYPNIVFDTSVGSTLDTQHGGDYKGRIAINFWSMVGIYSAIDTHFHVGVDSVIPQTGLYYDMLKGEHMLFIFAQNCLEYFKRRGDYKAASKAALGLVNLVYYKTRDAYLEMVNEHPKCIENDNVEEEWPIKPVVVIPEFVSRCATFPDSSTTLLDDMLFLIKNHGDKRSKMHAILCEIHHNAIMDNFSQSEEKLLNSKMHEKVQIMDVATKRHFYRAVAQLGLCAYRAGSIKKAHMYLSQVFAHGVDQALGQVVLHRSCKALTPNDEIYERRKLEPFYLRINRKLLEFAYKACEVLLKDAADMVVIIRGNKWKKLESILLAKLEEAVADTTSAPSITDSGRYAMITHLGIELKQSISTTKGEEVFGDQFAYGDAPSPSPSSSPSQQPEESDEESDGDMVC